MKERGERDRERVKRERQTEVGTQMGEYLKVVEIET
jgi:hypothetical protein